VAVHAIFEGYQGMVDGGDRIRPMSWDDVGGIMHLGGTVIGTARCAAFRTRDGRRRAARNLVERGIDRLVVIGGDGSLSGASLFREEWPSLVSELVDRDEVDPLLATAHGSLAIVGLVGSIDNDFAGTDMTIGTDTALHRITTALDQIGSTAASHQRTFVVEVMGRNCGYLALMGGLAGAADWIFIPEYPPATDDWESMMCEVLAAGRAAGRRRSIVVVAEGSHDRDGNPIDGERVRAVLEEGLGEDVRVTILGHLQRGGSPSAYDRWMSTIVGQAAVDLLLAAGPDDEPRVVGVRGNRVTDLPLMVCVERTRAVADAIRDRDYERAVELRTATFKDEFRIVRTLVGAAPGRARHDRRQLRVGVVTAGAPAPGMNTAVRAAVRLAIDRGHDVLAVHNGFDGLIDGTIEPFDWMSVHGWGSFGGSKLGTSRRVPRGQELYSVARTMEASGMQALLVIGGWSAYLAAHTMFNERGTFPAFNVPFVCVPASIDNNLPESELSIGADTALNNIIEAIDKIKLTAGADRRCFVVEVMGRYCGYLALMSGLASGAERVYLHEEGVSLGELQSDLKALIERFSQGKRFSLLLRNEMANPLYTTAFMAALFEEEGAPHFEVRQAILGHLQQGGSPSPFDRIWATRLAAHAVDFLAEQASQGSAAGAMLGMRDGEIELVPLDEFTRLVDPNYQRPKHQWWLELRRIERELSRADIAGRAIAE
jgi:6-phosphofructokinase 1